MAHSIHFPSTVFKLLHFIFVYLLFIITIVNSLNFSFSTFNPNTQNLRYEGDASPSSNAQALELTKNQADSSTDPSVGRVSYNKPVRLWDNNTRELTSFRTHFSFQIKQIGIPNNYGDGFTFFLVPFNSSLPNDSICGNLGLASDDNKFNNKFVAIEFVLFHNNHDPKHDVNGSRRDPSDDHIGIDVDSIVSVANVTWQGGLKNKSLGFVWVTYDSATHNLSVFLTYVNNSVFNEDSSLSYVIDLRNYLPDMVRIGFSAATGGNFELHTIYSWDFSSTLEDTKHIELATPPKGKGSLTGGVLAGISVLTFAVVLLFVLGFMWIRRKSTLRNIDVGSDVSDDYDSNTGPKRFAYHELSNATNSFSEEGKLGEGGFGCVYLGFLMDLKIPIAVKRVSRGSKQGKKEFASEVKIISRLRHRNLVQLLGWCHDFGELLLVYEFMPNGSLDSHIYGTKKESIPWTVRYRIALGLASSLVYLHEEWEQCVVHRDIKSSNIMLDSNFNAKLGDFGLARLVDHELGSHTTVLAGTIGYLAPECTVTGKASKESDVYSFGVVALEISCGRRPIERREDQTKVSLIEWVWDLYGKYHLLEAMDVRLNAEFDVLQTECLMTVGLWCCHPDYTIRPSISQAIKVLKFEAPMPILPSNYPVPIYSSASVTMRTDISSIPSSGFSGNSIATTSSSQSHSSSKSLISGSARLLFDRSNV